VAPTFTLTGTTGNDLLNAPGSVDTLVQGLAGNDTINLTRAGDAADAGAGNDTITLSAAGTVTSTINGGLGNDTIDVSGFDQFSGSIGGASGADVIELNGTLLNGAFVGGGAGSDTINITSPGTQVVNSTIQGGDNGDALIFNNITFTNSLISGAKGADTITVDPGSTTSVTGGDGQDAITITGPATYVAAGAGSDTLLAQFDVKTIVGGGLNDVINLVGGNGLIYADASGVKTSSTATGGQADGNDKITAGDVTAITIYGAGGNDSISVKTIGGLTVLDGGDGSDLIKVTSAINGNTTLIGGLGADTISIANGVSANLKIDAGAGSDSITVLSAIKTSTIAAGAGLDTITFKGAVQTITLDAGAEADLITFTAGTLSGGTIAAGEGADTIKIDANNKAKIDGGAGNDFIRLLDSAPAALADLSTIDGGAGVDTISVATGAGALASTADFSLNAIYGAGDVIYFGGTAGSGFTAANFANTNNPTVFVLTAANQAPLGAQKGDVSVFADAKQTIFYVSTDGAANFAEFRVQGKDLVLSTSAKGATTYSAAAFGFSLSTSKTTGLKITLA